MDSEINQEDIKENTEIINYKPKDNRQIVIRVISIFFVILSGLGLFFYKKSNPDFPLGTIIIIGAIVLLTGILAFFIFNIINKIKSSSENEKEDSSKKIPNEATYQQIEDRINLEIQKIRNMKKSDGRIIPFPGTNSIYAYQKFLVYPFMNQIDMTNEVYFIVNANYLNIKPIIPVPIRAGDTVNEYYLKKLANGLSTSPFSEESEIIERGNPILGAWEKIKRSSYGKSTHKMPTKNVEEIP